MFKELHINYAVKKLPRNIFVPDMLQFLRNKLNNYFCESNIQCSKTDGFFHYFSQDSDNQSNFNFQRCVTESTDIGRG